MLTMRGTLALAALAAVAPCARAFVLIDDFTVGEYHGQIVWPDTHDGHVLTGLDRDHSAFGKRGADVIVNANADHSTVFIDFGSGEARVSYDAPSGNIATDASITFGSSRGLDLDLSAETELWVDLYTEDPPNRLGDQWSITIADSTNRSSTNPGWLFRPGGVRFRRQDFDPLLDWSRINNVTFRQIYSPNSGDVPMAYAVTRVAAVPEPGTAATVAAVLLGLRASWRRRR